MLGLGGFILRAKSWPHVRSERELKESIIKRSRDRIDWNKYCFIWSQFPVLHTRKRMAPSPESSDGVPYEATFLNPMIKFAQRTGTRLIMGLSPCSDPSGQKGEPGSVLWVSSKKRKEAPGSLLLCLIHNCLYKLISLSNCTRRMEKY